MLELNEKESRKDIFINQECWCEYVNEASWFLLPPVWESWSSDRAEVVCLSVSTVWRDLPGLTRQGPCGWGVGEVCYKMLEILTWFFKYTFQWTGWSPLLPSPPAPFIASVFHWRQHIRSSDLNLSWALRQYSLKLNTLRIWGHISYFPNVAREYKTTFRCQVLRARSSKMFCLRKWNPFML